MSALLLEAVEGLARGEFPSVVDSTILEAFGTCERKGYWAYFRHQGPSGISIDLHAGICYAKGLEVSRRNFFSGVESEREAIISGAMALLEAWGSLDAGDNQKAVDRVLGAYEYYHAMWPMSQDYVKPIMTTTGPAVEFHGVMPLDYLHPVTREPLLYSVRFDQLAERSGKLFIGDDKTTKQLGDSWPNKWNLRAQFTGYCEVAGLYGYPVIGVVTRGLAILKTMYHHAEAITFRPEWHLAQWRQMVLNRLARMEFAWRSGYFEQALGEACNQFGGCEYTRLCETPEPERFLPIYYKEHKWDPLNPQGSKAARA